MFSTERQWNKISFKKKIVIPVSAACAEFTLANKIVKKYLLVLWSCTRIFSVLGYKLNKIWWFSLALKSLDLLSFYRGHALIFSI